MRTWIDRYSGRPYAVTTDGRVGGVGIARVKRYGEVVGEYRVHREDKSLAPDGTLCGPKTRGLLQQRPFVVRSVKQIGKESNYLDEVLAGLYHDDDEVQSTYEDPSRDPWPTLVVAVMREIPTAWLVRRSGRDRSTIKRYKAGEVVPRNGLRAKLTTLLANFARGRLREFGVNAVDDDLAACLAYLSRLKLRPRLSVPRA